MAKILAFSGSTRKDSFNKKLIANAVEGNDSVEVVDLKDYSLPIYDGDLEDESGLPENVSKLKAKLKDADGVIISCPEYNSGVSGALKNMIDWTSRQEEGEDRLAAWAGKTALIMSAAAGPLGGLRVMYHLRYVLLNINVMVMPEMITIRNCFEAFDEAGKLKEQRKIDEAQGYVARLVKICDAIKDI